MARVLVVDDEDPIRRVVRATLVRAGHEPDEASSGEQALRLATDRAYDIALVDFRIPDMDGVRVLKRLRQLQPGCLRVLMSGQLDLPTIMNAVNHGEVTRVIDKPFTGSALLAAIDAVLAARRTMHDVIRLQEAAIASQERAHLVDCLRGGNIHLAAQPILRASTGRPFAYELLLRSTHPVMNGPLPVLLAAERHGLLGEVSAAVIDDAVNWLERLDPTVKVFINIHPDELADGTAVMTRLAPLQPYAHRVVLEITERSRLQAISNWEAAVDAIADAGFALAVDDLGAGYSSLAVLAELKPAYVKVDMSIVRGIDTDPRKQRLVELLVRFADATQALLVAEGIETQDEADALLECGAHLVQGYLFGRPESRANLPGTGLSAWRPPPDEGDACLPS